MSKHQKDVIPDEFLDDGSEYQFLLEDRMSLLEGTFDRTVVVVVEKEMDLAYSSSGSPMNTGVFFSLKRDEARRLAISIIEFLAVLDAKEMAELRNPKKAVPPPPWEAVSPNRKAINEALEKARSENRKGDQALPPCPF